MSLSSVAYLVFLVLVGLVFWILPKKWQWVWMLVASWVFYGLWSINALILLLIVTGVNYAGALILGRKSNKALLLTLILGINLSILAGYKYVNFVGDSINSLAGMMGFEWRVQKFEFLLPLGISFYIFGVISYVVDVFRGKIRAVKNLGKFALYISFFPKIVAGPIERTGDLLPQFEKKKRFDYLRVVEGLKLFSLGLFKKLVIADNLALVVDHVFANLTEYRGLSLILTMIFYSWQIYADFAGYTDMARGSAKVLGFELVKNFNHPYQATSVRDFWRRWHMSLSSWFRDYLYIPLGGSRKGLGRTLVNIMIVFAVTGLWHGAAWTFVIWGLIHGALIGIERVVGEIGKGKIAVPVWIKVAYTYLVVTVSWVFFRAESLDQASYVIVNALRGVKNFGNVDYIMATLSQLVRTNWLEMIIVLGCLALALVIEKTDESKKIKKWFARQHIGVRFLFYSLVILVTIHLRDAAIKEFIYVRF